MSYFFVLVLYKIVAINGLQFTEKFNLLLSFYEVTKFTI